MNNLIPRFEKWGINRFKKISRGLPKNKQNTGEIEGLTTILVVI